MFCSSIKEINRLIRKGMSNIYYREKNWHSQIFDFLGTKISRNALTLRSKRVQGIFGKHLFWNYRFQLSFVYKCLRFLLICFAWEMRCFYQSFPRHRGWKLKVQKTTKRFCRRQSNDYRWLQQHQHLSLTEKLLQLFACKRKDLKNHF